MLTLIVLEASATRVYHKQLSDVVRPERPVVVARVVSSQVEILPNLLRITVVVEDLQAIHLQATSSEFEHSFSTQLERTRADGTVVRVSPIREGSGIEQNLEAGKSYLFILAPDGKTLIRVERMENRERVETLLKSQ